MSDVQEKVQKLITLAVDPAATPNEARNAALQAVKLIEKHELLYEDSSKDEELEDLRRQLHAVRVQFEIFMGIIKGTRTQRRDAESLDKEGAYVAGRALVTGRMCPYCLRSIARGDMIATPRGEGPTLHLRCYERRKKE